MTVSEASWVHYIDMLEAISSTAAKKFTAYLNQHPVTSTETRKAAIDYAYALATRYGEGAGAAACQMYDAVAEASGILGRPAEPAATATYREVAKTVNGIMKESEKTDYIGSGVGRLVKQAGVDTTVQNAIRDGAEWAWIPHGDTCAFCIMLASRGWQRASKKVLKGNHAEHVHANCDCTFAIRFNDRTSYAGYDPEKYRKMYEEADGSTPREKLNSMRREQNQVLSKREKGSIIQDRTTINAAKQSGDTQQPESVRRDYRDFRPLDISEDTRIELRELNAFAKNTENEHGLAFYQGGKTEAQTDNNHSNVRIGIPSGAKHVEVYHCHTDDSVLSLEDIRQSVLRLNVDREGVISLNGDVWVLDYSEGIRPDYDELNDALSMFRRDAQESLEADPKYDSWSFEERDYMLGRETMIRAARYFEWNLMGGHIDG